MPNQKTNARRAVKRKPTKRAPAKRDARNGNSERAAQEWIEPYDGDNPKLGLPELLEAPPTTEIVVHALFTAQHVINELRYHFQMGNLTRADKQMLAQLGKEIQAELAQEE